MRHALEVANGDLIRITVTDKATDQNNNPIKRQLVIAALISPGHADNSITISLGYGRKQTGRLAKKPDSMLIFCAHRTIRITSSLTVRRSTA